MSEENIKDGADLSRRDFLGTVTAGVAAAGVAAACVPFVSSMNPSSDVLAKATTEIDISSIPPGEDRTVPWQGKPVFVVHRTAEQISAMRASRGGKDPEEDGKRVKKPEWLVVVGICTHLGCVPNKSANGWLCPCHGSIYDNSGRIISGPAPRNLDLPPYHFVSENKILIGKA
ncbi:MAG: ubiquinol-cytochrome c reductase iron-sulfur subunit [Burkholderiales bacterium]|nr:ubiquinol-cytochrome c reductase iron-sulfur subunit [Burkholderiales bacterium]